MAYSGYLIKLKAGGSAVSAETLPMKYIAVSSYKATPDQRLEAKATRATTGILRRTTVAHKPSKIEFETPVITNKDLVQLNTLLQNHFTDALQRKLTITFYDNETDSYRDATCYMPDVNYNIDHVDNTKNIIYYDKVRYAFIEY